MAIASDVKKAMVLAAGEGTRLWPLTLNAPKVLLPIGGIPMILHTLNWLKSYGISQLAINLGRHGEKIRELLQDGSRWGLRISYSPEEVLLGTAGGVKRIDRFFDGTFVIVYGDVFTEFDLSAMIRFHREKRSAATLVLVAGLGEGVGIVQMDQVGRISQFVEKPSEKNQLGKLANGGIYILEREVLGHIPGQGFCDFAYDVFPRLIEMGLPIYGYALDHKDYLIDIGTPETYRQANRDVETGRLKFAKGAVFLDRDGTIARDVPYCRRVEDFELLPTVPQAIRLFNERGFRVVVVTNQSGIARGYFTEAILAEMHHKMQTELAQHGAWVDAIYHCPHHPDQGCGCRKPGTALFRQAAQELGLNLSASYVIGDSDMDVEAGQRLGCQTILATTGPGVGNNSHPHVADHVASSLLEAAQWVVDKAEQMASYETVEYENG
ncbi:MAG: D-glycero-beta-D-manno-heptose 1,7-bisphosphate 7-phosphatase [Chloroflexi bacterium]|nr:D-glycero-beta-D-manno-heptose 1,7-bisphosphate 7-phosphatase [Chloroflexota bacterium]